MSIEEIVESLKSMTLLEAYQLVSQIETTFELDASSLNPPITIVVETPPMGSMPSAPMPAITEGGDAKQEEAKEKTYSVVIESIPESARVKTFKVIRKVKELKISEARDFADSVPQTLLEDQSQEEAEKLKKELDECGATSKIV